MTASNLYYQRIISVSDNCQMVLVNPNHWNNLVKQTR